MPRKDIVVVGASAGGVEACKKLVSGLPPDFQGSVFIVIHIPGNSVSLLPEILTRWGTLPATHPENGTVIEPGHVYVAPPDHHMLVKNGFIRLVAGPEENYSRPAIDPLFRSASAAYGSRVVGVVLSGNLDDGTAGMGKVKQHGGTTIVQDLAEAMYPDMPSSVLMKMEIDYVLPLGKIAELLKNLAMTEAAVSNPGNNGEEKDILEMSFDKMRKRYETGKLTGITCPQCGGILREKIDGDTADFRCRVGHAFYSYRIPQSALGGG